ncbi:MAG: C13 family peptidase [Candidatus Thorarchaeota archaeon]
MSKKKTTKGSSRSLIILVLILIGTNIATLYYFMFLNQDSTQQDNPLDISDITGENAEQYIGQVITVQGYVVVAGAYEFLVTHPQYFWTDQMNSSNHLLISDAAGDSISAEAGMWISLSGVLQYEEVEKGLLKVEYQSHSSLQPEALPLPGCNEMFYSTTENLPSDLEYADTTPTKYAILFSGGVSNWYAYPRYWNHIEWFYVLLLMNGYDPDNIFVCYNNGTGDRTGVPVDYPGTSDGLNETFTYLSGEMGRADSLFVYVTDHGNEAGICTWNDLDPDGISPVEFLGWLDSISCHHMIVIMQQCFSGAFIPYLSLSNRIIMTACAYNEIAWASDALGYSEFTFRLLCAFYGFHIWGYDTPIWADLNNDGLISMAEAFGYAATMDSKDETPHYDDNGDQIGSTVGNIIGTDGDYGNYIFL